MRSATVTRKTAETDISVEINLDGTGVYDNQTGVGFFDHMLDQLARHALIDMTISATGDLHIDDHHTVEVHSFPTQKRRDLIEIHYITIPNLLTLPCTWAGWESPPCSPR